MQSLLHFLLRAEGKELLQEMRYKPSDKLINVIRQMKMVC